MTIVNFHKSVIFEGFVWIWCLVIIGYFIISDIWYFWCWIFWNKIVSYHIISHEIFYLITQKYLVIVECGLKVSISCKHLKATVFKNLQATQLNLRYKVSDEESWKNLGWFEHFTVTKPVGCDIWSRYLNCPQQGASV